MAKDEDRDQVADDQLSAEDIAAGTAFLKPMFEQLADVDIRKARRQRGKLERAAGLTKKERRALRRAEKSGAPGAVDAIYAKIRERMAR